MFSAFKSPLTDALAQRRDKLRHTASNDSALGGSVKNMPIGSLDSHSPLHATASHPTLRRSSYCSLCDVDWPENCMSVRGLLPTSSSHSFEYDSSSDDGVGCHHDDYLLDDRRLSRGQSSDASSDSGFLDRDRVGHHLSSGGMWSHKYSDILNVLCDCTYNVDGLSVGVTEVKRFVRNNDWPISHEIRSDIWKALCKNKNFDVHKRLYAEQVDDLIKSGVKNLSPLFTSFDGVVVDDHGLKESGAVTLQRLLIVIECVRPEIRYVPILYPLCSMFLHYMGPDETFACVMRLLSQGNGFLIQSEVSFYASSQTILALLKKYKRKVYNLIRTLCDDADDLKLSEIFRDWAAWIFKHLPFAYLVRVIDCFLVEGHKMLLRVVLSLTYVWYKEKGKTRPPTEFKTLSVDDKINFLRDDIVANIRACPISISTLIDVCTSIRNFKFSTVQRFQTDAETKYRDRINSEKASKTQLRASKRVFTQSFESKIIDSDVAAELMSALPNRFQLDTPGLIFQMSRDGISFHKFWELVDPAEQTLFIIKTTKGQVIGAYCSETWSERRNVKERSKSRYFGTGESFVFYRDDEIGLPIIYKWAGQSAEHPGECSQMFMTAEDATLVIGSGGGDAICIRDELTKGLSYASDTFASPPLVKNNEFDIAELEVFSVGNYEVY